MGLISGIGNIVKAIFAPKANKTNDVKKQETKNVPQKTDENEFVLEGFKDSGKLKEEKVLGLKTGNYIYEADGKKTYAQIKEELELEDGALRNSNYKIFDKISGNADKVIPEKGTKLTIKGMDLPSTSLDLKGDDGEYLSGFYKSPTGQVYYEVQYGDTQSSIYEKFENKEVRHNYVTSDVLRGYPEYTLSVGTKIPLEERSFLGKLFN